MAKDEEVFARVPLVPDVAYPCVLPQSLELIPPVSPSLPDVLSSFHTALSHTEQVSDSVLSELSRLLATAPLAPIMYVTPGQCAD
jgi:hypothetical protein